MLLKKLLELVKTHREEIAGSAIRRIRTDEETPQMRTLPEGDLRVWARRILETLQTCEVKGESAGLSAEWTERGRRRFESSIPLYEAVRSLHILKCQVIGFVRERAFPQNSLELYAQEELERSIGRFFDWLLYHIAFGYERARSELALLGT